MQFYHKNTFRPELHRLYPPPDFNSLKLLISQNIDLVQHHQQVRCVVEILGKLGDLSTRAFVHDQAGWTELLKDYPDNPGVILQLYVLTEPNVASHSAGSPVRADSEPGSVICVQRPSLKDLRKRPRSDSSGSEGDSNTISTTSRSTSSFHGHRDPSKKQGRLSRSKAKEFVGREMLSWLRKPDRPSISDVRLSTNWLKRELGRKYWTVDGSISSGLTSSEDGTRVNHAGDRIVFLHQTLQKEIKLGGSILSDAARPVQTHQYCALIVASRIM